MTGAIAIVVAAGRGTRMGSPGETPKQYRVLGGSPVLARAIEPFLRSDLIEAVLPVLHPEDFSLFAELVPGNSKLLAPVAGGATRQDSVRRGLEALADRAPKHVLVHDGVRPFVSPDLIERVLKALKTADGALPALAVTDTLKAVSPDGQVTRTVAREDLRSVQTPQGFRFPALLKAHRTALAAGRTTLTDDAAVAEEAGLEVTTVPGDPENVKITVAADFAGAERKFGMEQRLDVRVGQGFDVHAFGDGDQLMLCGIAIPFSRGLAGHSDADVALHALTDAVLGALCDGDIGRHFPPGNPGWKGVSSDRFLRFAADRARERGAIIDHLDVTLVCEAPKIGPLAEAMRRRIAEIAGISVDRVSVKATTTERLGFTGRGEGIAALATASVRVPA